MDQPTGIEMPRYQCHKEVWALKIKNVAPGRADGQGPGATLTFEEAGYGPISIDESWGHKHMPMPGGYYVVYKDGYKSFSPAEAFESRYAKLS